MIQFMEPRTLRSVPSAMPFHSRAGGQTVPGTLLPAPLRRDLKAAFTHDFANVRVHTDGQAERQARRLGARAFTVGRDISFAPEAYARATTAGRRLIAPGPFNQGRLEHFCTTPADYQLYIRFYIDAAGMPRLQPFRPPALFVIADFTPPGGSPRRVDDVTDFAPRYAGAGWPLALAFGELSRPRRRAECWACRRASPTRTGAPRSATATPSPASWSPVPGKNDEPDKNDEPEGSDVPDHTNDERSQTWLLPR